MSVWNHQIDLKPRGFRRWWQHVLLLPAYGVVILLFVLMVVLVALPMIILGQGLRLWEKHLAENRGQLNGGFKET